MLRSSGAFLTLSVVLLCPSAELWAQSDSAFSYQPLSSYDELCGEEDGDEGCAEISAYDSETGRIFSTNGTENELRVLLMDDGGLLSEISAIDLTSYGTAPNSVAVSGAHVAVAMEASEATDPGTVVVFNTESLDVIQTITAGALPDMLTFSPDGQYLLVANEGEPNADYSVDPEGSVSVIAVSDWSVRSVGFDAYNSGVEQGVRIFGPGATVAQDLEPEYITVSADSSTAWVALQENNALAIIDIASASLLAVKALGFKDHSLERNAFDASNRDGASEQCSQSLTDNEECIRIQPWPSYGMYQPDAIVAVQIDGMDFIVSANEGDARDYDGFSEEFRVGDDEVVLDPDTYPNAAELKQDTELGRLKSTSATGDLDGDGDIDQIYSYGARSFSIWDWSGSQVFDSGSEFETRLAAIQADGQDVWVDGRSDDKGPEPESVAIGKLASKTYAFIGLERVSGVFVYDISQPEQSQYTGFINTKLAGDISPEGLIFTPLDSNSGVLIVTNELSNTTSTYRVSFEGQAQSPIPEDSPGVVDGSILLSSGSYWQVQSAVDYSIVCEGFITSCPVADGVYNVINHTTGIRYENVVVGNSAAAAPTVSGNTISWEGDDWWQVQRADTYESICEGGNSCSVPAGIYHVINLAAQVRYENIVVE